MNQGEQNWKPVSKPKGAVYQAGVLTSGGAVGALAGGVLPQMPAVGLAVALLLAGIALFVLDGWS